ncbi:MAG TPA: hypothetical protein P5205_16965 [Candidatus Paceibacterota bacterium]|nr:hypothetical protein [Verrucomicrobiota bacterium]HSA12055.1 hypothetical protein [Candidatus Paceibacterota bacterium]
MRALGSWLSLLAVGLTTVSAQVTVEVTQEQDQFLPGEAMPTAVRITNRSGQDLRLGGEEDWLTFSVQGGEAEIVRKLGEVPVVGEFVLGSSRVATKRVDLAPYFSLTRSGRYTVSATVRIKQWNRSITSDPRRFGVVEGAKLWEQEVGVPAVEGSADPVPEVRKFILQQANFLKSQLRLYVRLTDAAGARTFRVIPIGPMVSFGRPVPQVDKFSNLHLLYQDGAHSFNYTVINPQGEVITRQTYDYLGMRPRLEPDREGKVLLVGGIRRPAPSDIPPAASAAPVEDAPAESPSPGKAVPPAP